MKNLLLLATIFTVLQIGHSLTCYKCNGCETASLAKETCRNVDPATQESACLTQKLRIGGAENLTIKKCTIYDKSERFDCPTLPTGDTFVCQRCYNDLCNSGTKLSRNFYLYVTLLGLVLVPNFLYT